jgi:hypothetical protein
MDPFATLDELQGRLEWTLNADEEGTGTGALEDLSNWARFYGRNWEADAAPRLVKTLVLSAAAQFMRNPDAYVTSRAGDEAVSWPDRGVAAGTATFATSAIKALKLLARPTGGFGTGIMTAWGPQKLYGSDGRLPPVAGEKWAPAEGEVPLEGGQSPFPLFNDETPW